jgi:RND family efflux transporter MFP subunit
MLAFAVAHALHIQRPEPKTPPPVPPPTTPFGNTVAGAGMVEPSTEASGTSAIAVGTQLAGVVTKINVRISQEVKAGDLLFELDKSLAEAQLKVNEAQVAASEATAAMNKDQRDRGTLMLATRAIAEQDMVTLEQTYRMSVSQLELAKAQVGQTKTQLTLLQVRAPVDGTILQVNVRPGEYVSTSGAQSLILMGNLKPLHVRVNVDEEDLPRLELHAPARAKIRGDVTQVEVPLTFVRLEPYIVPKTSLTGVNTERVDTRVVQVIFAVDPDNRLVRDNKVLVGQLVDVFIDTRPNESVGR